MKPKLSLFAVLALILCVLVPGRVSASTLTVQNLNDSGVGSLRAAIAAASSGDTIDFAAALTGTITLTSGELLISQNMAISGPGASQLSVSGNHSSRVFEITAGLNVAISGLTITGGYAPDRGGGLLNDGSNLTLSADVVSDNVTFESATNQAVGGGVESRGGALAITGCQITGNQALAAAGASTFGDSFGGGVSVLAGTATISNSTFSHNLAQGGDKGTLGEASGGAIYSQSPTTVIGSTFDHNQAVGGSGSTGTFFVDYSFGGAIANSGSISIASSTFTHNEALGGNNSIGTGPPDFVGVGGAEGGALYSEVGTTAIVTTSVFDHNLAQGGKGNTGSGTVVLVGVGLGGAIVSGYGGSFEGPATLTVSNTTFTQNGVLGGDNNSGTATVAGLVGVGAGSSIANYAGGTASISGGSQFNQGQAAGGQQNTASGTGAVFAGLGSGAAIFNYLGNYASSAYGILNASALTIDGSTFDHNDAQGGGNGEGGGIANLLSATTTMSKVTIRQNQANGGVGRPGLGGGLYNDATSSLALTDCSVTRNRAKGSPGAGGGVYNIGTFSFDSATVIDDNHASTSGDNIGP